MLTTDARLRFTENWYRDFIAHDTEAAERDLIGMIAQHAPFLASLDGRVLDVGGGAGLVARFLDPRVDYSVLDPSAMWHEPAVAELGSRIRQNGPEPRFIAGVGEALPFDDREFDAVLAFWSLNHAADPYRCIGEIGRVLRPDGVAYLVLEDMVPSWRELFGHALGRAAAHLGLRNRANVGTPPLREAFPAKLLGRWPLSPDHVSVDELRLVHSAGPDLLPIKRQWVAGYLTVTFKKRGSAET